jgi:hypothetical protein
VRRRCALAVDMQDGEATALMLSRRITTTSLPIAPRYARKNAIKKELFWRRSAEAAIAARFAHQAPSRSSSRGSLAMFTATRRASSLVRRLFTIEIDVSEVLPVRVGDDEAFFELLDRPGRREAAAGQWTDSFSFASACATKSASMRRRTCRALSRSVRTTTEAVSDRRRLLRYFCRHGPAAGAATRGGIKSVSRTIGK